MERVPSLVFSRGLLSNRWRCTRSALTAAAAVTLVLAGLTPAPVSSTGAPLTGSIAAVETGLPIEGVRVVLDSVTVRFSLADGSFSFGAIEAGPHVLVFEHIAYSRRSLGFAWPDLEVPLRIRMEPRQFVLDPIPVTAERTVPSLPVSSVSFGREATTLTPGTIANDPLRTVQSHPSAAAAGVDFLSTMAVRGGDPEEHRVYYDEVPLRHAAHAGGFSSVVYDDMLATTVLVPGAAPIRYHGALSGVVMFVPEWPDTSLWSLRYDITSMAAGMTRVMGPSLALQASAKTSFFNLPVYQQAGVESRTFRDVLARAVVTPRSSLTVIPTLLLATDSEIGSPFFGTGRERDTSSALAAVEMTYHASDWDVTLRPYYSYYRTRDALTWAGSDRDHKLNELRLFGEVIRPGTAFGLRFSGEVGAIEHDGFGGHMSDTPFSGSAEIRMLYRDALALVLGAGGSREEWTSTFEPEAYGSLRISLADRLVLSAALRRSHQTPYVFNERRYFASIPIDAGELVAGTPSGEDMRAVQMDQTSAAARLHLPFRVSIEANGFLRRYERMLEWDWSSFPVPSSVANGGNGHGEGYELILSRNDPDFLSFMVAYSRSRVWKTEGTLTNERVGDFDLPEAWQAGGMVRLSRSVRLSVRWTDLAGRPFTPYAAQSTPPPDTQVNSTRLARYQRLDIKLTLDVIRPTYHATFFLDVVNAGDRRNIATTYALEVNPGEFTTVPYGGARFFPIAGITVRW